MLTALAEFPPKAGTRVRNLHVAYIIILLLVFQTTAHAGQLKTEIQPLPWQGQCFICENQSDTYFAYVTSWGLWVLDLDFSCLIPLGFAGLNLQERLQLTQCPVCICQFHKAQGNLIKAGTFDFLMVFQSGTLEFL